MEFLQIYLTGYENERKNYALAKKAIALLTKYDVNLIELKGYKRDEVNQLLNACDLALLPSKSEGSPQFIKEAMACNCPIISTDVGDVKDVIKNTKGCYITSYIPADVANKIKMALNFGKRTEGRGQIEHLDNRLIAARIVDVYKKILE